MALDETLSVADFPAPGASIFGTALSRDLGGKGANQAIVLARTGLTCRFTAAVGADARGQEIARRLAAEPLEARLMELAEVPSDFSIILMADEGENAVITTREAAAGLCPDLARSALDTAGPGDLLVLQGNLSGETTAALLCEARTRGMRTAMNPSPLQEHFQDLWTLLDMVFVNEGEAQALGGVDHLRAEGVAQVVLTLGGRGAALIDAAGHRAVPGVPCAVVDTTGAGDCFMAVSLGSAMLRGTGLDPKALEHASRAAAHTVARPGTVGAFPTGAELARMLV
ncbi:Carbohydrate kinase, PfkB/Ribokinase [Sagittula stellata E-37]|uniref:Carbohydrate kinase, PfkB/Ribokinase n=1 Tax=Sagittula stellata (strain ATCC 700073 / DSM 11524 / E-37) TaxID=388399 RepID=A3K4G0_SAGS3|nr:Carbohydrate kinase, PfkB/Ribokinase [Sagittula stellata E-37]